MAKVTPLNLIGEMETLLKLAYLNGDEAAKHIVIIALILASLNIWNHLLAETMDGKKIRDLDRAARQAYPFK